MWEKSRKSKRMFTVLGIQAHSYWYSHDGRTRNGCGGETTVRKKAERRTFPILSIACISFFLFFPLSLLFLVNHYYYNDFTFLPKHYATLCVFVSILN